MQNKDLNKIPQRVYDRLNDNKPIRYEKNN